MKKITLSIIVSLFFFSAYAQQLDSTALVLIDIQNFYFPGGKAELHEPEKAAEKAQVMLNYFRENEGLVIHVRHNFEPGGEIHDLVKPEMGEKIISKNEVNVFLNTEMKAFLDQNNIKNVVLAGMQTHMCLEAATRAAHDFAYSCTVIADACATRDLKFGEIIIPAKEVHFSTLSTLLSYANVLTVADFLK